MRLFLIALLSMLIQSAPARAEQSLRVVELFTSQGCSSCPPADAIFADLAKRNDVIALSYHIDYWDYLGWRDRFSAPEFSARQKAYAIAAHEEGVYTPQTVINGHARVVGSRGHDVVDAIDAAAPLSLVFESVQTQDAIELVVAAQPVLGPQQVQIVHYLPGQTQAITAGENAGRDVYYANIVEKIDNLGLWTPTQDLRLRVRVPDTGRAVVLIQDQHHGVMRGAFHLR